MKPVLDLCPTPAQTHCSGPGPWLLGSSANSPVGTTFLDCSPVPLILPDGFLAILPLRSLPAPPDKPDFLYTPHEYSQTQIWHRGTDVFMEGMNDYTQSPATLTYTFI